METSSVSRRDFLASSAAALGTGWALQLPMFASLAAWARTAAAQQAPFTTLTPAEARTMEAFAAQMRAGCYALEVPEPLSVFENVLVEPTPELERQRSQYAAYLAMFDEEA